MTMSKLLLSTPHISDPSNRKTVENLNKTLQAEENEAARREGRPAVDIKPVTHQVARAIDTIRGYMDQSNIVSQSEAEFSEFGRLAQQDPRVATEFGALLGRIAEGGQGGISALAQLGSSQSMVKTLGNLLTAPGAKVAHDDIKGYIQEGQAKINPNQSSGSLREDSSGEVNISHGQGQQPRTTVADSTTPQPQIIIPSVSSRQSAPPTVVAQTSESARPEPSVGGSAESLRQAAEAMTEAAHQIRRSAAVQAQAARRLNNIQPPSPGSSPPVEPSPEPEPPEEPPTNPTNV